MSLTIDAVGNLHDRAGQFAGRVLGEADPDPLFGTASEPEPSEVNPDDFEWDRIESLMGNRFHLSPSRTASIPKINADDTVQQMTRKLIRYVAKTQDVSEMDDAQVAEMAGLLPCDEEISDQRRRNFGVGPDDRIVTAMRPDGRVVYLSTGSVFKRTGSFYSRLTGEKWDCLNLSQQVVQDRFSDGFAEANCDIDRAEIDALCRRVIDPEYGGKGWAHLWDESTYDNDTKALVATVAAVELVRADPHLDAAGLREKIDQMSPDEIRGWLAKLPTENLRSYTSGGWVDREVYVATMEHRGYFARFAVAKEKVEEELAGTSARAKRAKLNRAYRAYVEEQFEIEYDYQRNRRYIRDAGAAHNATVFEQKKNIPQSHLDAAEHGYFRQSGDFRHVEVDADTDLGKLAHIEQEYAYLRRFLPQTDKAPALRFRKTGRHHALGVYHPHVDNVATDPRSPSAFLHEFIHHVDHTAGGKNVSASDEFRPLLRAVQRALRGCEDPVISKKFDYYATPTEVLSRTAELYFHWKGLDTSLNGDATSYGTNPAYTSMAPLKDQIVAFWDSTLAQFGAEVPR